MTRYIYGGGGDGDIIKQNGLPFTNATALVWTARSGGTQITDLRDLSNNAIFQVTSDAYGQVIFYGPDEYIGVLWLDFGTGPRWALAPKATDLAAAKAIAVQRASDAATLSYTGRTHLPYNAADPLEQALATALDPMVTARFGSDAERDAAFPTPAAGDRCYRTDLARDQLYDAGVGWVSLVSSASWAQSSPTVTPTSGTFGIGSGSRGLRYRITGRTVSFYMWLNFAADTTYGTGVWTVTTPFLVNTNVVLNNPFVGQAVSSAGRFPVIVQAESTNTLSLWCVTSTTNTSLSRIGASPVPGGGTWGAGNFIRLGGSTELA